jgi:hypothetical protein
MGGRAPTTVICPTCRHHFFSNQKSKYCSRECSRTRSRENDRKPYRGAPEIIWDRIAVDLTIDRLIERIVPGMPPNTKDQLVMFVSILRGKGFDIVNCNEKSLVQLVELVKNQTNSLLKDCTQ